jgi:hypothetical protein
MLVRSLFEDMVVAHWLVLNRDDSDWLVERFERHRDAMALYQDRLQRETGWHLGPPVAGASALRSQQNALFNEFGGEAQKDWWDPGSDGKGAGKPLGLRGVAQRLEVEAASGGLFAVRFAGGREAILTRMELVVHKWLTQFLHHTALGLPFAMTAEGIPGQLTDPSATVLFAALDLWAADLPASRPSWARHDGLQRGLSEVSG